MNPKQLKKLKKRARQHQASTTSQPTDYIAAMTAYQTLFADYPTIKVLINNVLQADRLLKHGLLPQTLPHLLLPDDTQDVIFQRINAQFPVGDPEGDRLWDQLSAALPDLDEKLRSFRDYLETEYGMWAYISAPFVKDLADFVDGRPALEVMAGNGYVSKGLQDNGQTVIATDSKDWTAENETGRHPVTDIEPLSASEAVAKYGNQVAVIIMAWSPDGLTIDWDLLRQIRALDHPVDFVVIGERNGATGSKLFWQNAEFVDSPAVKALNAHYFQFDLIADHVYLVK
ncbi:SAM-dependent methyltransferase [Secundilactobacillus kimchicus]|uniref:SAM-dependent methyltransferase n=1 Tax=Secundilactobacillus kimchicus TaxID=528209 RepID=UPI001C024141|nr:SAM-dependent methyltransferase [Secundilactobacillus kimchicus]MBT9672639.1 SAM-dependent methyltransferase [Secundilactobacillus kimchicus]